MKVELEKDRTLFASGPIKIEVLEGHGHVFGKKIHKGDCISVPEYRALPVYAEENLSLKIDFIDGGNISEYKVSLIPEEWCKFAEDLARVKGPIKVIVLGDVDVGKTAFVTFLANMLHYSKRKVAIIDADTGQSDIGPPTTIGIGIMKSPLVFLSELELEDAFFIGLTSPSGLLHRSITGIVKMVNKASELGADVILIDTTGWVFDRQARDLKTCKIQVVEPDYVVLLQRNGELEHLVAPFRNTNISIIRLPASPVVRPRSREERREIRRRIFSEAFKNGREIWINLNKVGVAYSFLGTGLQASPEIVKQLEQFLNIKILYCEESPDSLLIILPNSTNINGEVKERLKETFGKREVIFSTPEKLNHLLVSFTDNTGKFLGLGCIIDFDLENQRLKIYTKVEEEKISTISFGYLKVNPSGEEEGWTGPWPC